MVSTSGRQWQQKRQRDCINRNSTPTRMLHTQTQTQQDLHPHQCITQPLPRTMSREVPPSHCFPQRRRFYEPTKYFYISNNFTRHTDGIVEERKSGNGSSTALNVHRQKQQQQQLK